MDMGWDRLNVFVAVAEEQGFTKAAARLRRTQPAISQAIRLLEEEIGEPLFERLGRSIKPTQAGAILLEHAREAFDALEGARARIGGIKGLHEGTLTIATSDTTACYLLPAILRAFRRRHPGIEIRILNRRSPEAVNEVASRQADIGIITLPEKRLPASLASEPLVPREDVGICAPRHALARRRRVSFDRLADYPLLLLDHGSNTRSFIDEKLRRNGMAPRIAMELGTIEAIKKLVQLDFGVSIVPRIAIREELRRGLLHSLQVFSKQECRMLGVIHPGRRVLSPAAQAFVSALRKDVTSHQAV